MRDCLSTPEWAGRIEVHSPSVEGNKGACLALILRLVLDFFWRELILAMAVAARWNDACGGLLKTSRWRLSH